MKKNKDSKDSEKKNYQEIPRPKFIKTKSRKTTKQSLKNYFNDFK